MTSPSLSGDPTSTPLPDHARVARTDANRASVEVPGRPAGFRAGDIALVLVAIVAMVFVAGTVATQVAHLQGDWQAFDRAATRAVSGDRSSVYLESRTESLPFLYPPYTLWLLLPLAALPELASYLVVMAASVVAVVASFAITCRVARPADTPAQDGRRIALAAGVVASFGPVYQMVRYGQLSPLYLLAFTIAAWAGERRRPFLAGCAIATLAVKPNLLVPVVVLLFAARAWPTLRGVGVGVTVLVGSTLPFGAGPWLGFLDAVRFVGTVERTSTLNPGMQVTLMAALRVLCSGGAATRATAMAWAVTVAVLGIGVLRRWWRASTPDPTCWGLAVLFVVAANPRLYFYDAIVLVLPALLWWLRDQSPGAPPRRGLVGALLGAIWVAGCVLGPATALLPAVGPLAALWLLAELGGLRSARVSSSRSGSATTSS